MVLTIRAKLRATRRRPAWGRVLGLRPQRPTSSEKCWIELETRLRALPAWFDMRRTRHFRSTYTAAARSFSCSRACLSTTTGSIRWGRTCATRWARSMRREPGKDGATLLVKLHQFAAGDLKRVACKQTGCPGYRVARWAIGPPAARIWRGAHCARALGTQHSIFSDTVTGAVKRSSF